MSHLETVNRFTEKGLALVICKSQSIQVLMDSRLATFAEIQLNCAQHFRGFKCATLVRSGLKHLERKNFLEFSKKEAHNI